MNAPPGIPPQGGQMGDQEAGQDQQQQGALNQADQRQGGQNVGNGIPNPGEPLADMGQQGQAANGNQNGDQQVPPAGMGVQGQQAPQNGQNAAVMDPQQQPQAPAAVGQLGQQQMPQIGMIQNQQPLPAGMGQMGQQQQMPLNAMIQDQRIQNQQPLPAGMGQLGQQQGLQAGMGQLYQQQIYPPGMGQIGQHHNLPGGVGHVQQINGMIPAAMGQQGMVPAAMGHQGFQPQLANQHIGQNNQIGMGQPGVAHMIAGAGMGQPGNNGMGNIGVGPQFGIGQHMGVNQAGMGQPLMIAPGGILDQSKNTLQLQGFPAPTPRCQYVTNTNSLGSKTRDLIKRRDTWLNNAKTKGTHRTYNQLDKYLDKFQAEFNSSALTGGASTVSLFVTYLSKTLAPSTIRTMLSALAYKQKMLGIADNTKHFLVQETLVGFTRHRPQKDTRRPITIPILRLLVSTLKRTYLDQWTVALFSSMFLVAFFALLRIGEIVTDTAGHTLTHDNILVIPSENRIVLTLSSHKHSKPGVSASVSLYTQAADICPVHHLRQFLERRTMCKTAQLFVQADGRPVTRGQFMAMFNNLLKLNNLDPESYKGHSFRIGGATYAAARGLSDSVIRRLGRWKSNAFVKYIRDT